jgi:hypothetical protein
MIMPGNRRRDSAYYSIIEEEWPRVRQHLESRLARLSRPAEPVVGSVETAEAAPGS